jgi:sec-independent protein translocase protein TatC
MAPENGRDSGGTGRAADPRVMSFGEHLEELRRRLIRALIYITPVFAATLYWGNELLDFILQPARRQLHGAGLPADLIATAPLETLGAWLKVSGVITIVVSIPILLYQVWAFVRPGLYPHERRVAGLLVPLSVALSAAGLAFLYYIMLPAMLHFLILFGADLGKPTVKIVPVPPAMVLPNMPGFDGDPASSKRGDYWFNADLQEFRLDATPPDEEGRPAPERRVLGVPMSRSSGIAQQYKVSEYIDLVLTMSLAFVAGFQTPVVVLLLGWVGILNRRQLAKSRKYALFVAFLVAAILTPSPDPFNMTILAVPLYILFELGLFLLRVFPPSGAGRAGEERNGKGGAVREGPQAGDD